MNGNGAISSQINTCSGIGGKIVWIGIIGNDISEEKTFQNITVARIYRDNAIDNLESNGYTILSVSISLVRL